MAVWHGTRINKNFARLNGIKKANPRLVARANRREHFFYGNEILRRYRLLGTFMNWSDQIANAAFSDK